MGNTESKDTSIRKNFVHNPDSEQGASEKENILRQLRNSLTLWTKALQENHTAMLRLPEDIQFVVSTDKGAPFSEEMNAIGTDFIVEVEADGENQLGLVDTTGTGSHGGMRDGVYPIHIKDDVIEINTEDPWRSDEMPGGKLSWGGVDAPRAPQSEGADKFILNRNNQGNYGPIPLTYSAGPGSKRELEIAFLRLDQMSEHQLKAVNDFFIQTGVPDAIVQRGQSRNELEKKGSFAKRVKDGLRKLVFSMWSKNEQGSGELVKPTAIELRSSAEVREELFMLQSELTKPSGERNKLVLAHALLVIASYLVRSKVPDRVYTKWLSNIHAELPQVGDAEAFDDFVTSLAEQDFSVNNTAKKWYVLGGQGIVRLQFSLANGVLTTKNLDHFSNVKLLHDAGIQCSANCQHI